MLFHEAFGKLAWSDTREVMRDILQSRYLRSNVAHKQLARTSLRNRSISHCIKQTEIKMKREMKANMRILLEYYVVKLFLEKREGRWPRPFFVCLFFVNKWRGKCLPKAKFNSSPQLFKGWIVPPAGWILMQLITQRIKQWTLIYPADSPI